MRCDAVACACICVCMRRMCFRMGRCDVCRHVCWNASMFQEDDVFNINMEHWTNSNRGCQPWLPTTLVNKDSHNKSSTFCMRLAVFGWCCSMPCSNKTNISTLIMEMEQKLNHNCQLLLPTTIANTNSHNKSSTACTRLTIFNWSCSTACSKNTPFPILTLKT